MDVENIKMSTSVRLPIELYVQVEAAAGPDKTPGRLCAEIVAKQFKFTLPGEAKKASKYGTPEEKKVANQARRDDRKAQVQAMLTRLKAEQAATVQA